MVFYLSLFGAVTLFGYLLCNKTKLKHRDIIFVLSAVGFLCFLSCIRYDVGFDYSYGGYTGLWNKVLSTPFSQFFTIDDEPGFTLFTYFLSLFGKNYQIFYIGNSILIAILAGLFIYRECGDKVWGFFMLYGLGMYYCSMNLIRQTIAALIFAFAIPMVKKKKPIPYMLLVLLASTVHKSALLMIPFYFILQIRLTKAVLAVYMAATLGIFLTSDIILKIVTKLWYGNYMGSIYLDFGNDWYYMIACTVFFAVIYIYRDRICSQDVRNHIYINCAFFYFFFWIISWKHMLIDRFTMYFETSVIIALYILIKRLYNEKNAIDSSAKERSYARKRYASVVVSVAVSVIIMNVIYLMDDGHGIIPYNTIFNSEEYRIYCESLSVPDSITMAPEIL